MAGACTCDCPKGCCDASGVCQPGDANGACGASGNPCQDCGSQGKVCESGTRSCVVCEGWTTSFPGPMRAVEIDGDGTPYAAGDDGKNALFARLDPCGTVTKTSTHLPTDAAGAEVHVLTFGSSALYASGSLVPATGSDPQNGMWARVSKPDLKVEWMTKLNGTTGKDQAKDIVHAGGALWISGTADLTGNPTVWGVKGVNTTVCGFTWLGSGIGRDIQAHPAGAQVYFTGGTGAGEGFVARQSDTACTVSPCGPCIAPWSITFQDDANSTEGRALLVSGNDVYVAGHSVVRTVVQTLTAASPTAPRRTAASRRTGPQRKVARRPVARKPASQMDPGPR